ncbi:protein-methionine-sulfoxide reductase catalytic subunit MsrP [Microvirga tunisiensis]|uniref:Protein-methionine-sulfoxide reductase catalytic subunit MsrP n=2 Tax=Pannonibacter tanglangensis TaxID=2750084 RepID=A0A7X5J8B9_9HYPH|nr:MULTISPECIES: protein-methionine-sulfoxide reductase catalytic subunit MsrP [unclassified Pannonibacter]NBN63433.1 protein-methionine-sulfoxide reductase catalytic subunit MsrP [Pannonibacter sp. XCT-34]NBN77070.1 protein-methionine-sulfoxide reductase catalytic subunit MsrP [Pannonibacter sp. XCT-53]
MNILHRPGWTIPEHEATPEAVFFNRRQVLAGLGLAGGILGGLIPGQLRAQEDPSAGLYPVARNPAFTLDRDLTNPAFVETYNNFYEFGSHKRISAAAQQLSIRPWTVKLDGLCDNPQEIGIDDLLKRMPLEERLYRFRCVEAWAMAVPWSGFALAELVKLAAPRAEAKYVRMETFLDPSIAPGQKASWYPWPYVEGLTLAEATNELAFMATGVYGKPLPKQSGAPIRLVLPWKYGFKSIKSVVRISFTDTRPVSFWEEIAGSEYGFWANVNPEVPHPRWSQADEELLGTGERRPTLLFNGYGEQVAGLYKGLEGEKLFM